MTFPVSRTFEVVSNSKQQKYDECWYLLLSLEAEPPLWRDAASCWAAPESPGNPWSPLTPDLLYPANPLTFRLKTKRQWQHKRKLSDHRPLNLGNPNTTDLSESCQLLSSVSLLPFFSVLSSLSSLFLPLFFLSSSSGGLLRQAMMQSRTRWCLSVSPAWVFTNVSSSFHMMRYCSSLGITTMQKH